MTADAPSTSLAGNGRSNPEATRLAPDTLAQLAGTAGLTGTASDVLDSFRLQSVADERLRRRTPAAGAVAGHARTMRYLPERAAYARAQESPYRLGHDLVLASATPGDVLVVESVAGISCFGGVAAAAARRAGFAAVIVDGGLRDLDEICESGLPAWSASVTPRTGKWRLEVVAIDGVIGCGGVQVRPGDLVLADDTGICFVPAEAAAEVAARVLEVAQREAPLRAAGQLPAAKAGETPS